MLIPRARRAVPLAVAALATLLSSPAGAAPRVFPVTGSGVINGDVTAIGGTNAAYLVAPVDVDSNAATSDSSSEVLVLPAGSAILNATLVWNQDCIEPCSFSGANAINTAVFTDSRAVLVGPDNVAHSVFADGGATYTANPGSSTASGRWAYADVTALLQALWSDGVANQRFAVGDIVPTYSGSLRNATWAIFVVYENPSEPTRAVAVDLEGVALPALDGATTTTLTIANVQLPSAGPISGAVVVQASDGQASISVTENIYIDAQIPAQALTNAANPLDGVWNHSIAYLGVSSTTALPSPSSRPAGAAGIDLDTFDISGLPTPGATQVDLIATTTPSGQAQQEFVVIMALALSVDVEQPDVTLTKQVTVLDGAGGVDPTGAADAGDTLVYTVTAANGGNETAIDVVLEDAFPPGTSWVPGSLTVAGAPIADGAANVTLAADGVTVALGSLAVGGGVAISFRLRVDAVSDGAAILNIARVDYGSATSAVAFAADSNAVVTPACGNGLVEGAEGCDDGAANGAAPCACTVACAAPNGAVSCDDDDPCTVDACAAGACAYTPADAGAACDDGSLCTNDDACDGAGSCAGAALLCSAPETCDLNTCDEATGECAEHNLSCAEPVFFGVVAGPGGVLGSIRCAMSGGVVSCDMDGGALAIGPPMCQ